MTIENESGGWVGTISDYSAARVITVSGQTLDSGHYYGLVSDLPEMFHHLIAPLAVMFCKAEHPVSPEKPSEIEILMWKDEFRDALHTLGHEEGDERPEDVFTDFGTTPGHVGVNVPGQGYLI